MKRSLDTSAVPVLLAVALSSAALFACQTQPDRNLGDSLDDRSLDLNPPPAPTEPFGVSPLEFVGRWVGVAEEPLAFEGVREAYAFPSGSTQFELEILPSDEPTVAPLRGTLVFGSGSPPPPLDPEVGFPSDVDYGDLAYFIRNALGAVSYTGPLPPYEGFSHQLVSYANGYDGAGQPLVADGVLRLEFDTGELLAPWCALQEPQPTSLPEPSCVKGNGFGMDDEGRCFSTFADLTPEQEALVLEQGATLEPEQVDCNKLFLCVSSQCTCTEAGCFDVPFSDPRSVGQLIVRRDGDALSGIFSNTAFLNERQLPVPLGTVRFTRIED